MRGATALILTGAMLLVSCGDSSTPPDDPSEAGGSTTVNRETSVAPPAPTTSLVPAQNGGAWQPGSVTCDELQGNVPEGVDDFGYPSAGIVEIRWGDEQSATIQFADDATCTADSDAWLYLIHPSIIPVLSGPNPEYCDLYSGLRESNDQPANLATVLGAVDELCP